MVPQVERQWYQFGDFRLDARAGVLLRSGKPVPLRPKAVETLRVLVENDGRMVPKEELLEQVWLGSFVEESGLARNICDLRKALREGNGKVFIETIPKRGYRFAATVEVVEEAPLPNPRSIAVFPLTRLGTNRPEDDFGLRVGDALIARLETLRVYRVLPTAEVEGALTDVHDAITAGRQLGVDYVLAGNVQELQGEMRIGVRLLDIHSGASIWAETLIEKLDDLDQFEISIAEEVAGAVALKLSAAERKLLTRRYTESREAYQLYLRGRYYWSQRSAGALKKAIALFEHAIAKDPEYAPAFSGLADCYSMLPMMAPLPASKYMPRAKSAALSALDIDETLAEARASLAFVKWHYDWNWAGAEREFKRLLQIRPERAVTHQWYALLLAEMGRSCEAAARAHKALRLDPGSISIRANLATVLHLAGRNDEAINEARQTLAADPTSIRAQWTLGLALEAVGQFREALTPFERAAELSQDMPAALGSLGHLYATIGKTSEAKTVLARLQGIHGAAYSRALVHLALGARAEALEALEQACNERSFYLVLLKVDSRMVPLRCEPKFQVVLKRIHLG